ncbi:transposase [Streptomyces sp. NBC_01257]|uniref:transposase n=1 Tax=Streptomyces sp. NBC_01257 TaxID=2903799 RepID=UPI003FA3C647
MTRGDLTDEQWERVELLLPLLPKMGRPPRDRGQVFGGIWWWARTGSPWRDVSGPVRAVGGRLLGLPALSDQRDLGLRPGRTPGRG